MSLAGLGGGTYYLKVSGAHGQLVEKYDLTITPPYHTPGPVNYAVLFAGGADAYNNWSRYYTRVRELYGILVNNYSLAAENIYILYADGTDAGKDRHDDFTYSNSDMSFAGSSAVLPGTHDNLQSVLAGLATTIDADDHFFFWTYDHGGGASAAPDTTGEENLTGWNRADIRDDELAPWLAAIHPAHATYVFLQCFAGGMLDDITIRAGDFGASATNHYEVGMSTFPGPFNQALQMGMRQTADAYRYAYLHDAKATGGEGPGGTAQSGVAHPWSTGADFRIFHTAGNAAPTLTSAGQLAGAALPGTRFQITWDMLSTAANEADADGDVLRFNVSRNPSLGTLYKNGAVVSSAVVRFGEFVEWMPAVPLPGVYQPIAISASDGLANSPGMATVSIRVAATATYSEPAPPALKTSAGQQPIPAMAPWSAPLGAPLPSDPLPADPIDAAPVVTSFTVGPAATIQKGVYACLTAGGRDPDEGDWVEAVRFYEDRNLNGIAEPSEFLAEDADVEYSWNWQWDTSGHAAGAVRLLAVAVDRDGTPSTPMAATLTLTGPDSTPPQVLGGQFCYWSSPHAIQVTFSENVGASLQTGDLIVQNVSTSQTIPGSNMAVTWDQPTRTATFTFPGLAGQVLPNGRYHLVLTAGGVTDVAGNALPAAWVYDSFQLTGDLDRDGSVTFVDLLTVAANFTKTNVLYGDGDTDGDGTVSFVDLLTVAGRFGQSVPLAAATPADEADEATGSILKNAGATPVFAPPSAAKRPAPAIRPRSIGARPATFSVRRIRP